MADSGCSQGLIYFYVCFAPTNWSVVLDLSRVMIFWLGNVRLLKSGRWWPTQIGMFWARRGSCMLFYVICPHQLCGCAEFELYVDLLVP